MRFRPIARVWPFLVARWWRMGCATVFVAVAAVVMMWSVQQWLTWPDVASLATERPSTTAFIERYQERERAAGRSGSVDWNWVPWSQVSAHVARAVVSAEDMEFFSHHGFSEYEIGQAIRKAISRGSALRGASTITQQLAKNLWLSPSRNPLRKLREVLLTRSLESHLSKRRMLEIYLNVVEFGPGVYGVGAAAPYYFGKPAATLTVHEAAMLAASLPRPTSWHPGVESEAYARYVADIEGRMARAEFLWRHVGEMPVPEPGLVPGLPVVPDSIALAPAETVRAGDTAMGR
jgi:monofunctional biosynthetic peptidoglycan transglycosylase